MNFVLILAATLAPVFTDNMVLQRDLPVPVWGTASPAEEVRVEFAGQSKSTKADAAGKWLVKLDPMPASAEPRTLTIQNRKSEIQNILVGDVWIAAGQSNMEWPLAKDSRAKEELPVAQDTGFRLCNWSFAGQYYFAKPFGKDVLERLTPEKFYRGNWQPCTPASAKAFSAVAYYFGKELRAAQKIPVGIINLAVGGSPTEAWIRNEMLPADLPLDPWCLKRMKENIPNYPRSDLTHEPLSGEQPNPHPDPLPSRRERGSESNPPRPPGGEGWGEGASRVHHPFEPGFLWDAGIARLVPMAMRGVIWYQGESNAETDWRVKQHEMLFTTLVTDWRKQFNFDFPFLFVQLPQMDRPHWPAFREQQARLAKTIPNVKMAVTIDLPVDPKNVHPPDKQPVGQRLARLALELK